MGGWSADKIITLTPTSETQVWKLRLSKPSERSYSYHCVHHLKDGTTRASEPVTTQSAAVSVDDPFEGALEILFFRAYDPQSVKTALVDVIYDDPDNEYHREERLAGRHLGRRGRSAHLADGSQQAALQVSLCLCRSKWEYPTRPIC